MWSLRGFDLVNVQTIVRDVRGVVYDAPTSGSSFLDGATGRAYKVSRAAIPILGEASESAKI